jgi:hypothetical protein
MDSTLDRTADSIAAAHLDESRSPADPPRSATRHVLRSGIVRDLLLVAPFLVFFYIQIAHHQLWQDELNAWGIAVASPTLGRLFHLIRYEAHPSLWYLLLWVPSRFTANPVAMKLVELPIGTAIYLFLALKSPFSRTEKALLFLSYFISFEYTVLSRMYGLLLLLTLVYAYLRTTRPERMLSIAAALALMSNTDMMGILLSSAFALEYLVFQWREHHALRERRGRLGTAVLIYLAGTAIGVLTLRPAKDITHVNVGSIFAFAAIPRHLVHATLNVTVLPWMPISLNYPRLFWEPDIDSHKVLYSTAFPFVMALLYATFRRNRSSLLVMALTLFNLILFEHLVYFGFIRHHGMAFVGFLVALWIQRSCASRIPAAGYVLLTLSAIGGILAAIGQWTHPFSNAGNIANEIRARHLNTQPLIGTFGFSAAAVAEMMAKPIYILDCNCIDTFEQYDNRRDNYDLVQVPDRMQQAMRRMNAARAVFISTWPLPATQIQQLRRRGIQLVSLGTFSGAEAPYDPTALYEVDRANASAGTSASSQAGGREIAR